MRYLLFLLFILPIACTSEAPPMGPQVECRDSLPVMATRGVSKLISDSGIVRYKIIAEEWLVFDKTHPQRQEFPKGVYLERYDDSAAVNLHISADTAFCFDQYLWKLRGRVVMNDRAKQITYTSDELYWDMRKHIFYSNAPMTLQEPDRLICGNWFESDEQMKQYKVGTTKGYMPMKTSAPAAAPSSEEPKEKLAEPEPQSDRRVKTEPVKMPQPMVKTFPLKNDAPKMNFNSSNRIKLNTDQRAKM